MVNERESVFKDREMKQAKVIDTPEPKRYWGSEDGLALSLRGQQHPSVDSRHLTRCYFLSGTWKPSIAPLFKGKHPAKGADGCAGLGGRKKRMMACNGSDSGLNVTALRKQAHVRLVSYSEIICGIIYMKESK